MDLSIFRGLNEAYSAVYDEDIRNELEEMSDDFAGVEYLSDEELDDIVDETIGEMLDEGYNFGEVEDLLEGVLLELNPYAPAGSAAAKQYQKSASSTKKSAERSAARAATVARVKGAVTGAIGRLKGAAKSAVGKAKEAGRSAKFNVVDKPVASYAASRNLHPAPGMAARSKDPEKRRGLRAKVLSDIKSRVTGKIKSAVDNVASVTRKAKQKAASAAVSGYAAGRVAAQTASDAANRAGQGAKNAAARTSRNVKSAVGKTARSVSSRAGNLASRLGEEVDVYDIILSHLLDEGYADTYEAAESIMVNMSEDWRESIVEEVLDEAYVDYRKGKLSTGESPQQRMSSRLDHMKATARRERGEVPVGGSVFTPATTRSQKMGAVKREMDAHTGVGGAINKALTPGLGNRAGASPRVAYGEPNTERHQRARYRRGEPSTRG